MTIRTTDTTAARRGGSQAPARREAISDYAILDTPPEAHYDAIAATAARVAGTPIGLVSFVDREREWVKAASGAELGQVDRQRSFADATVVADTAADERFAGHPWVAAGPRARFYAAVPLCSLGGVAIGTLAVLDTRPRDDGAQVVEALGPLARVLEEMLEQRREAALGKALTCVVDFDMRFVRVSRGFEELLGRPVAEIVGRRYIDFVHPDDVDRTMTEARAREQTGVAEPWENRYLRPDGEVRWVAWHSQPVPEEGVIYAAAEDVTDRKCHELALEESEHRYRLLAEAATDMVVQWDLDGQVVYASSAIRALLGYEPEQAVGKSGYDFAYEPDRPLVAKHHQELLEGADSVRFVFRARRRDGEPVWVESTARVLHDSAGRPIGIQSTTRDMTESKRATDALHRAEERFRKAFDEGPVGMAIVALDGRFQRVNHALEELIGCGEDELAGLGYEDVVDVDTGDMVRDLINGADRAVQVEGRLRSRDDRVAWVSLSVSLVRDGGGEPAAFLAQFLDVSERHRAEAESRRAREAAERANRAKSQFLARMSHELRTPLNAILGFAQLLELDDLAAEQRDSVARIVRGGRHLVEVINDVLDISRIEAGELPIELGAADTGAIVDATVQLLAPLAAERGMTVRSDVACELYARADRQRLKQVLLNLISNAIKYAPEGSEVLVRTMGEDGRVRIAVVDQGPGVDDEAAERIFMPFERLGKHARIEGTGLGLALSRNLVRAMGGEIGVRPAGPGSEFWVELEPAEPGTEETQAQPALDVCPADGCVLYIEDTADNVEVLRRMLDLRPGIDLLVAADGKQGLECAREQRPDAILLDLTLPDMSGEQVLEELKADLATASIPVVAVSADATSDRRHSALAAGAEAFQAKPLDLVPFLRTLDAALAA
jgi:PAS domain S-box-containing protein